MEDKRKVVYYTDELADDFAGTNIDARPVTADYPFARRGFFWRVLSAVVYRGIVTPAAFFIAKIGFGLRVKNRRILKKLRGTGFYTYGNHTQTMMDALDPSLAVFPRRSYVVTGPDAVSIKGIRTLVALLGAIPLPTVPSGFRPFFAALDTRIDEKCAIAIYPESHIWPWYTGIRPFRDTSFAYPVSKNVPCVAFVTTFRQRRIFKKAPPLVTVTLGGPFYPDASLPAREARKKLRDEVYDFMCAAAGGDNYEYVRYVKKED